MDAVEYDVVILGAGPAGCTAAILLGQAGKRVLLIEKDRFPRFRIGESLLPNGNPLLRRLGVWERMEERGFLKKYGAEFTVADGSRKIHNRFSRGMMPDCGHAFQVERAGFDAMLLERVGEVGASVRQETTATQLQQMPEGWQLHLQTRSPSAAGERRIRCSYLIDASGRDCVLAGHLKLAREALPYPKRIAFYRHYHGVKLQPGDRAGNIVITRLQDGWAWDIPLQEDLTSIGIVAPLQRFKAAGLSPEAFFEQEIHSSPELRRLLQDATPAGQLRVTADYSYLHQQFAGERHFLVGDAAGFVDPIFSSGVYLAMDSAAKAADSIIATGAGARALRPSETRSYTRSLKRSIRAMQDLIEVFYDDSGFAVFMNPTHRLSLAGAVNAVVSGNTRLPFRVWWRFQLFLGICRFNRRFSLITLNQPSRRSPRVSGQPQVNAEPESRISLGSTAS